MKLFPRSLALLAMSGFLAAARVCLASKQAKIDHFTPPVQNYAVIDISGTTATSQVTSVALNDQNGAAFGFSAGTDDTGCGQGGYAEFDTYTWQNGKLGDKKVTKLVDDIETAPYETEFTIRSNLRVLSDGKVYGAESRTWYFNTGDWDGDEYCRGYLDGPFDLSAPFETNCYYFGNNNQVCISAVSDKGVVVGSALATVDTNPANLSFAASISFEKKPDGNFLIFDAHSDYSHASPPLTNVVNAEGLAPYYVNDSGWFTGYSNGSCKLWKGALPMKDFGGDHAGQLNNQGQVAVENYTPFAGVYTSGYLWENDATTILSDKLPDWIAPQYFGVQPFSISNQVTPAPKSPADPTIHIVAYADGVDVGANGKMLWTRDKDGKWTFANIALPDGTTIEGWQSINSSGVIAAIGNGGHALLLFPMDVEQYVDEDGSAQTNSVLTPSAIVDKDKKQVSNLKIGKMVDDVIHRTATSTSLSIDNDADRFFVRIIGAANGGVNSVKVQTVDNPDANYNCGPIDLDLSVDGKDLVSKSLLLMADSVDDSQSIDGITSGAKNDRTYKIQLGGNFKISSVTLNGVTGATNIKTPVRPVKTVTLDVRILRNKTQVTGGASVISQADVEQDLKVCQERYAQVGVKFVWTIGTNDPPAGVDLSQGLKSYTDPTQPTPEETALLTSLKSTVVGSIRVVYVNSLSSKSNGESFYDAAVPPSLAGSAIISSTRRIFTLAHELGHVLKNTGFHASDPICLMRDGGTSKTNVVEGSKRLTVTEEILIQGSTYAK